ncbi:MAG: hypothetical protein Q7S52_05175 [bacterium]|nr:hypothetical protein [bacterium]
MTGSADEAVPAGETKVSETARPEQVREFDAKLLQQLPDLSKEQMQHLMDHREELQARLSYYGLKEMEAVYPRAFCDQLGSISSSWKDFYADVFGVVPDFSRVRLTDSQVYTYTTPVFVATRLDLQEIFRAIERFGVECSFPFNSVNPWNGHHEPSRGLYDIGRSEENYIASFSSTIIEGVPKSVKDETHYRAGRMSLREYLLWILQSLYRKEKGRSGYSDLDTLDRISGFPELMQFFFGTMPYGSKEVPFVELRKDYYGKKVTMTFESRTMENSWQVANDGRHRGVRRVKLFKSLPQI